MANDTSPIYDNTHAGKTKEVMMLSQLLPEGKDLQIIINGDMSGKRGYFESLSENNDLKWKSSINIYSKINNCANETYTQALNAAGYSLKSHIADGTIVAYREAIKQLKQNGAKYIFVGKSVYIGDLPEEIIFKEEKENCKDKLSTNDNPDKNKLETNKSFGEYFQYLLTHDTFLDSENIKVKNLPEACFQKSELKAADVFWGVGQLAAIAIGVKGAQMGNTNMASLGANTSHAVDNTSSLMKDERVSSLDLYKDSNKLAGIARNVSVNIVGFVDKDYIEKNEPNKNYYGYVFPVSEVEEHLSHYKVIPYDVKKITSN
jgi:hypothetical protein